MVRDRDEYEDEDEEDDWEEEDEYDPDDPETYPPGLYDDDGPATVPCPHCGAEILEDSEQCPRCEAYISKEDAPSSPQSGLWWVLAVMVLLAMVILVVG